MSTTLTVENVQEIFVACLFHEGDDPKKLVIAKGITKSAGFHSDRLRSQKPKIDAMLTQLPNDFQKSGGGGMSFLCACMDKDGNQWTGEHTIMEQLFQFGIAVGSVKCPVPEWMWCALPGGMPYYVVDIN